MRRFVLHAFTTRVVSFGSEQPSVATSAT